MSRPAPVLWYFVVDKLCLEDPGAIKMTWGSLCTLFSPLGLVLATYVHHVFG
ncbi:hypothetical protein BDQ94DRAFT_40154 [Aspergillus welwitschiae]|uniref:Uncharacterized protein n=1 Tax=Aspergillus welwitschiae TaxID=1341132 RepID=A0A3F3Q0R3_9EURO|nr:hypothetical protein BDQ94DRAFT_40154 [Aspergillus welwitschiae]RDH32721.1 hypothetical protein BDQ94DRAFT_40154 [Aspergillus welwitschiae]